jgi:RecB family exonuclease
LHHFSAAACLRLLPRREILDAPVQTVFHARRDRGSLNIGRVSVIKLTECDASHWQHRGTMEILAGIELGGASLTAFGDHGSGGLGSLVCGPLQLLRELELRVGRGEGTAAEPLRLARWQARVARLASAGAFFSRSFSLDPLATARTLLSWRDSLIEAGWTGDAIADGGHRLDALAELEALDDSPLPPGAADRLREVARALPEWPRQIYDQVLLSEPAAEWGPLWQRIFCALNAGGTHVTSYAPSLPGASPASDLGRIQSALTASVRYDDVPLQGDGSFVVLTAETSWEAARATAALCSGWIPERSVVIRQDDTSALEHALEAQGLPTQGWAPRSPWRAALQILPLALELAFEPKDPARVLELLTLPGGPFAGRAGRRLARAVSRSPGVGSPDWQREKSLLVDPERVHDSQGSDNGDLRERIESWLEQPGAHPAEGAAVSTLIAVIERVQAWLLSRITHSPEDATLLAAAHQAATLRASLAHESRATLDLLSVRRKVEDLLGPGVATRILPEQSARLEHVDRAEALSAPRENVIWWFFANGNRPLVRPPWNHRERLALEAAALRFPDPAQRVTTRALQRRRAVLAATKRMVLVVPRGSRGQATTSDPLWDEILARATRSNSAALRALHVDARELLHPKFSSALLRAPERSEVSAVCLPGGHLEWTAGVELPPPGHHSAYRLAALFACPFKWGLEYYAGLRSAGHGLPRLHQLSGTLGHRLVEVLHAERAFELADEPLAKRARVVLDELVQREGTLLLRPGMSFELSQLREQLVQAITELARILRAHAATIDSVERSFSMPWRSGVLEGRLDLLLRTRDGGHAILDLKWGTASYRDGLMKGQALQLAIYAVAQAGAGGGLPDAAYFSLKAGKLLALATSHWVNAERVNGPALEATWSGVERSMDRAEQAIAERRFAVTGLRRSLPLLESLGVPAGERHQYYVAGAKDGCTYCDFDAVCGRRWEAPSDDR